MLSQEAQQYERLSALVPISASRAHAAREAGPWDAREMHPILAYKSAVCRAAVKLADFQTPA
jgi:hypothetical protein